MPLFSFLNVKPVTGNILATPTVLADALKSLNAVLRDLSSRASSHQSTYPGIPVFPSINLASPFPYRVQDLPEHPEDWIRDDLNNRVGQLAVTMGKASLAVAIDHYFASGYMDGAARKSLQRELKLASSCSAFLNLLRERAGGPKVDTRSFQPGSLEQRNQILMYDVARSCVLNAKIPDPHKLHERIASLLLRPRGIPVRADRDMVSTQGSSLTLLRSAILNWTSARDTILVPAGTFAGIYGAVEITGRTLAILKTEETNFKVSADKLESCLHAYSRQNRPAVLILVDPLNATGLKYTRDELEAIAKVCIQYGLKIICDELYGGIGHEMSSPISLASLSVTVNKKNYRMYDHSLVIQGLTKVFPESRVKMTFACSGHTSLIKRLGRVINGEGNEICVADEQLAFALLPETPEALNEIGVGYGERLRTIEQAISAINSNLGIKLFGLTQGTQSGYMTCLTVDRVKMEKYGVKTSSDLEAYLMFSTGVETRAVGDMYINFKDSIPVRINFGSPSKEDLQKAFERLGKLGRILVDGDSLLLRDAEKEDAEDSSQVIKFIGG